MNTIDNLSKIRTINDSDIKDIYNIETLCFKDSYSEKLLMYFIKNANTVPILIEYNKKIIGYALGLLKFKNFAHIISIAIHPQYQNKGFGKKLLVELLEIFRKKGKNIIRLEVRTTNKEAIKLYQHQNFQIIDLIKKYYTDDEDAYLMELHMNQDELD